MKEGKVSLGIIWMKVNYGKEVWILVCSYEPGVRRGKASGVKWLNICITLDGM